MTASSAAATPLPPADAAPPRWMPSDRDKAAFLAGPVLARLTDHSVLGFEGADAVKFLQGQITIDVAALSADRWQPGGYCSPKGRLLAIFDCWRQGPAAYMLLPAAIAPAVQRRLKMFVLRSHVTINDVSPEWIALGAMGHGAGAALAAAGVDVPADAGVRHVLAGEEFVVRLPAGAGCPERLLLMARAGREDHWNSVLGALARVEPALWWWAQIDAGVPAVISATQELFVPQAVNLEVLGGVNFRKGCYPGQEIVARSQYLGKLRRRMFLAHGDTVGAQADIFQDGAAEAVGRIVLAAGAPTGGWDLLFECPTDRTAGPSLHAGGADAAPLRLHALPYTLFDPTA